MNINFYDIESLSNVFSLANYDEKHNHIDVYILCDTPELLSEPDWQAKMLDRIYSHNRNFTGTVSFLDLKTEYACRHLSRTFGCTNSSLTNNAKLSSDYDSEFRLVCDTDKNYDPEIHPYLAGYNSYNYDTTMLAIFETLVWTSRQTTSDEDRFRASLEPLTTFKPTTAKLMREHNNMLFSSKFKPNMPSYLLYSTADADTTSEKNYGSDSYRIRKNMLLSGRHLDVARLNEKQSKVALKRLLGMLGFQILESDKLKQNQDTIENADQLYDLIAYNVSDIVNLKQLFYHKAYQAQFELKLGLLHTYPETIYMKMRGDENYKPDIRPESVDKFRLNIDSSSAQFATRCLCPYGHLKDIKTVSFNYPAKEMADLMGIKQVNVLDEAKKFFYSLYPQPHLRAQFDNIYNWYKSLEGKNFNDSPNYQQDYPGGLPASVLKDIPKPESFLPYFDEDGNPTSCFAIFSTGGVHGAEYNKELYGYDMLQYENYKADFEEVMKKYPNPVDLRKARKVIMDDGRELAYTVFLKSGLKIDDSEYRDYTDKQPYLAKQNKKGMSELNKKYNYTSAGRCNHEDFTSYYPNLLRRMMAFFNKGLGYDRYAEIFQQKEDYGKLMNDKSLSQKERDHYRVLREGTKLILNSASGAADAMFNNNIRANNQIVSMRIIGQIFSWRIGQAQTAKGSKIISTNTDGLYSVMEDEINNKILADESKDIGVAIEPEPMILISKDTNNRIEVDHESLKVLSASGGTLGCRMGPNPTKALAHSAILDWALTEYLICAQQGYKGLSLHSDFNDEIGMNILKSAINKFEPHQFLLMFQNVISSSPSSYNYIFGTTDADPNKPIIMQHYNRMFILKDNTPNTVHLWAANAKAITPATKKKRARDGVKATAIDGIAMNVLKANGVDNPPYDKDVVRKKVTNIENDWYIFIQNKDLNFLSQEERDFIINNLDYSKYLDKLRSNYETSWRNHIPYDGEYIPPEDSEETEDNVA